MAIRSNKFVLFSVGDKLWAMPLIPGMQFISADNITAIPQASKNFKGLIYNSGNIVTVLNTFMILKNNFPGVKIKENIKETRQHLLFSFQNDVYSLLISKGDQTIKVKQVFKNKTKSVFNKYIKLGKDKIYILYPEDIWRVVKLYD